MAHIKCRYRRPMCCKPGGEIGKSIEWNEYWWCDSESDCCDYAKPKEPVVINGSVLTNPQCRYLHVKYIEFEKNYKEYEYDGSTGLLLGRRRDFVPVDDIEYLEVDDRILVNEEVKR